MIKKFHNVKLLGIVAAKTEWQKIVKQKYDINSLLKTVGEKEKEKILSQTIGDQQDFFKKSYTELLSKAYRG